ncbi:MAG TPA: hypothetical protein VGR14_17035, partial [Verrucomicrobiae bacterium]|nr:hypothetical protein [Verrucomicrobiae bacterium]
LCKSLISMKVSDNPCMAWCLGSATVHVAPKHSRGGSVAAECVSRPLLLRGWIHVVIRLLRTGNILASLS